VLLYTVIVSQSCDYWNSVTIAVNLILIVLVLLLLNAKSEGNA